jgi:hypothetical protein
MRRCLDETDKAHEPKPQTSLYPIGMRSLESQDSI